MFLLTRWQLVCQHVLSESWKSVIDSLLAILALILLLALDLAAIAARAGFAQSSHARLLALREGRGQAVNTTIALLPALPRLRAGLNLTLVMARFLLAGLSLQLVIWLRSPTYPGLVAVAALLVAALLLFWLEWAIEWSVFRNPELWACRMTPFVRILSAVMAILLVPLTLSNDLQSTAEASGAVTEDELKSLVDAGEEEGVFEVGEKRMIYSIFDLGDTVAREIMVPRIDMLALDVDTPLPQAVDALLDSGHSRAPVYEESVDNTIGLLYVKDLLRAWREADKPASLREMLRPAYFAPEAKKVDELLEEMQSQRIHMAIVVDEYGGVAGLVTLEDIVEEVLGEIQDEYDQGEEAPYQKLADDRYVFQGRIGLNDFNEIMGSNLTSDEADSLGGYIYSHLGWVPTVGETIEEDNAGKDTPLLLTVEQVSARRIRKVGARWLSQDEKEQDHANG
jgi:putative hemolysin